MFCDLTEDCPGFYFYDDDRDNNGKGNTCDFYDPGDSAVEVTIPGIISSFKDDSWSTTIIE